MKKVMIMALVALVLCGCSGRNRKQQEQPGQQAVETVKPVRLKKLEMVQIPIYITDEGEMLAYMAAHYWDKFDFTEMAYIGSDEAEQALVDYFMVLAAQLSAKDAKASVTKMMERAAVSNDMFNYFAERYEHYLYDPNSPYRNEDIYITVLESVVSNPGLEEIEKLRARSQLAMALKNRPGEQANDFSFTTAQGQKGSLYGIKADYTLLFFYNLGCTACKEVRHNLLSIMSEDPLLGGMFAEGKFKILALYPDEDMTEWDKYAGDIPSDWINAYDPEQKIKEGELYELRAIPSLYLLDKDKKVIAKDFVDVIMVLSDAIRQGGM